MLIFRAIHDIAAGEEITISYTHTLENIRDRREMLQKGWEFHCGCPLCLLEAKTATDVLEECQRLIEEWRLVHREWDAEIRGGKPVNTEGGEDSPDWVQAPVALGDLKKLVMRLEKTYDKKEYGNQPRLAAAYWGVELIVRMPQGVWPHEELGFALGTLRNFGYFMNIQGDEIIMVRSQSIMPAAAPNILVDCTVLALNTLVKTGRREVAMRFYGLVTHLLSLFYADPRCFDDMCYGGSG